MAEMGLVLGPAGISWWHCAGTECSGHDKGPVSEFSALHQRIQQGVTLLPAPDPSMRARLQVIFAGGTGHDSTDVAVGKPGLVMPFVELDLGFLQITLAGGIAGDVETD